MATTSQGGNPAHTVGELPAVGEKAPDFTLVDTDLKELSSSDVPGRKVLNIFPSIGTGVCQASVRRFNELAAGLDGTTFEYPAECLVTGRIDGREVGCLSAVRQAELHSGYEPRDVDRHDLALLRGLTEG